MPERYQSDGRRGDRLCIKPKPLAATGASDHARLTPATELGRRRDWLCALSPNDHAPY